MNAQLVFLFFLNVLVADSMQAGVVLLQQLELVIKKMLQWWYIKCFCITKESLNTLMFKAVLVSIYMLTMGMIMCNIKGVSPK